MLAPRRKLVRVLLGAAVGCTSGGTLAVVRAALAADAAPPRAVLADPERDLGILAPGEAAVATFRIENRGGAALTLAARNPQPYVAGVRVDVQGAPVPSGGAATVTMTFDTAGIAGLGSVQVPIETNDPGAPRLVVGIKLEVRPLLAAEPGYARYSVVQKEREGTIVQTVWASDAQPFRVLKVESPSKDLRVTFREASAAERRAAAGSQWRIESVLASDATVGALGGDIVVVTDHPRQKQLRIPLSGFVRPVMAVTPPVADIGEVDATKPFRFTLDVKNFATEDIALEGATSDLPSATVQIVPVKPGRSYKVRVAVPAGLPAGTLSGTVQIFTASPKVPRIDVPVRGRLLGESAPADRS